VGGQVGKLIRKLQAIQRVDRRLAGSRDADHWNEIMKTRRKHTRGLNRIYDKLWDGLVAVAEGG
jgi:hypothetical protein